MIGGKCYFGFVILSWKKVNNYLVNLKYRMLYVF